MPKGIARIACALLVALGIAPDRANAEDAKFIAAPDAFQTLVNPPCSHCIDEAKRRAGELKEDDPVLAWMRGMYDGGAIPHRFFLAPYRVISDTYGVFVYDHEAGFSRGFEPSLDFTFHGWRNGVMVLRHKDGTLFSALSGRAFDGPRKGETLKPIPTLVTRWGYWNRRYAGTVAYHMFEKYQPVELPVEDNAASVSTRLMSGEEAETPVIGVEAGERTVAYTLATLKANGDIIHDRVGEQDVVALWYAPTGTAATYAPEIDESEPPQTVRLNLDTLSPDAPFKDRESGSHFDIAGRAVDGPLAGKTLRWLPSVQCKWFAWKAEYPDAELRSVKPNEAPGAETKQAPEVGVIVAPEDITPESLQAWQSEGAEFVVLTIGENHEKQVIMKASLSAYEAGFRVDNWIDVGRNASLANAHPEWMASIGMHDDWQARFPQIEPPRDGEVAKAYPWVPIGYRDSYQAQVDRTRSLMRRTFSLSPRYWLCNLQGGPASCGCGNLQCRWALDYHVSQTADHLTSDSVVAQFLTDVDEAIPCSRSVPVWTTECETIDLPSGNSQGHKTGLCGSVPCATGRCPTEFRKQWDALLAGHAGEIALLAVHGEFGRTGDLYGEKGAWVAQPLEYVRRLAPTPEAADALQRRIWLVIQGYGLPEDELAGARDVARRQPVAGVLIAKTRIDQSYEPRIVKVPAAM